MGDAEVGVGEEASPGGVRSWEKSSGGCGTGGALICGISCRVELVRLPVALGGRGTGLGALGTIKETVAEVSDAS